MERNINLEISLNGDVYGDFDNVKHNEGNYLFQIGVKFCPKTKCEDGLKFETLDSTNPDEPGECFDIFQMVFKKLQEKNLVSKYYLDEMECEIEASHPDYEFLKLINLVQDNDYYGIGFVIIGFDFEKSSLGLLADGFQIINNIENWLQKVIDIVKEIKSDFQLLKNDTLDYKIENFINIEMHSLED